MTDLSPFQTLPLHIAEVIAHYCVGLQRHRTKDAFGEGDRPEKTWLVLHDVSRSWMHYARRNFYKSVYLQLSKDPEDDEFTTTLHSCRVIEQSIAIMPHVTKVDIHLDDIVEKPNEEDLEKLSRVWPDDLVFPKARSLTCNLGNEFTVVSRDTGADRYFKWFIERVRSSFPNLQEMEISFDRQGKMSIRSGVLFSKDWNASLFLSALFRVGRWGFHEPRDSACINDDNILIGNAPELTSFHYIDDCDSKFASRVARKSAKTLEKLHYSDKEHEGFKALLFNDYGQAIVYPRLRDLHVFDRDDAKGEHTTDISIVPFPALQRLGMYSSCAFKDDTLFRGFNGTLVSLNIGLHRGFVDIFRTYKVFLHGAYPNVLHITVTRDSRPGLDLPADEFAAAAFELVSSATQSITINGDISYEHITGVISKSPYLENIQILILDIAELSLLEMLDVLKHFPRMTDFGCCFQGIDSELSAIQDKLIPNYLGMQYPQLNSRLKCWHMYYSGCALAEEIAVLVVTLAVLCPNFTFVKVYEQSIATDDNKIEYILSSGLYDQHAERLGHIFD